MTRWKWALSVSLAVCFAAAVTYLLNKIGY
jgi:hypothetical protein